MIYKATLRIALLAFVLVGAISVSSAYATGTTYDQTCTSHDCIVVDAIQSSSTSTSTTATKSTTEIKEMIKTYEKRTKTIIAVHMVPDGLPSAKGCVDPIKKGWIKAGQKFRNTRANGAPFWDVWQKGWKICGAKRVKAGGRYYMQGTKLNCGNSDIRIPIGKKKIKVKIKKSYEVKTYKEAQKLITSESTSTTNTTTTTYTCPAGYTPIENGTKCKHCPPPTCECPPGSTIGTDGKCHKDGTTTPPPPPEAPGPNPQPSPDEPYPGGYMCYWESSGPNPDGNGSHASGEPVADRYTSNGCPAGSYGG